MDKLGRAVPPEERYAANLKLLGELIHSIVAQLHSAGVNIVSPHLISLGLNAMKEYYTPDQLIRNFIVHSHLHWPMILQKKESFFTDNLEEIFSILSKEKMQNIRLFKKLIELKTTDGRPALSMQTKNEIWKKLHSLVKISIKYAYERGFQPQDFQLEEHAKMWDVKFAG